MELSVDYQMDFLVTYYDCCVEQESVPANIIKAVKSDETEKLLKTLIQTCKSDSEMLEIIEDALRSF